MKRKIWGIELQSQNKTEEEEKQPRETLTLVYIESREPSRLQEESRENFLSKLEKVVTPEGFVYYVDNSSAKNGGDDCLPISDSDHEGNDDGSDDCQFMSDLVYDGSDDEEVEFHSGQYELVGCTQETSPKDVPVMTPEIPSLVGSGEVYMREIESIHRTFAESLAENNLRAKLIEEISTVIEEVPCIVEKRGCVYSRDEEESFPNENKVSKESNGSDRPASVSSGSWRCIESQIDRVGEIFRQVKWSGNPGDLKGKWPKLCGVNNPQAHTAALETSTRAIEDFQNDRSAVQRAQISKCKINIKFFRGVVKNVCSWDTARVFEASGTGTTAADLEEVFDNCTSIKQEEQLVVISRASEGVVSWGQLRCLRYQSQQKRKLIGFATEPSPLYIAGELTQRTKKELQKGPQLLTMARLGTFQKRV